MRYLCEGCRKELDGPGDREGGDSHAVFRIEGPGLRTGKGPTEVVSTGEVLCGPIVAVMPASHVSAYRREMARARSQAFHARLELELSRLANDTPPRSSPRPR